MQTTILQDRSNYEFPVELQPVYTKRGKEITRNRAVVRTDTDTPISVVSSQYTLITHKEVVDAVKPFVRHFGEEEPDVLVERDGARIVSTFTFNNRTVTTNVGDTVALRVHAINSYDRSGSVLIRVAGMVLRCKNGMTVPAQGLQLSYRHSGKKVELEMPDPEIVWGEFQQGRVFWSKLETIDVRELPHEQIGKALIENKVLSNQALEDQDVKSQIIAAKTGWDLYNALTYGITHKSKTRNRTSEILRQDRLNRIFKSFV